MCKTFGNFEKNVKKFCVPLQNALKNVYSKGNNSTFLEWTSIAMWGINIFNIFASS